MSGCFITLYLFDTAACLKAVMISISGRTKAYVCLLRIWGYKNCKRVIREIVAVGDGQKEKKKEEWSGLGHMSLLAAILQLLGVFWLERCKGRERERSWTTTQHYAAGQDGGGGR